MALRGSEGGCPVGRVVGNLTMSRCLGFHLEPIIDLRSDETPGFALTVARLPYPDWKSAKWRAWYARMAQLLDRHLPPGCRLFVGLGSDQVDDASVVGRLQVLSAQHRCTVELMQAPGREFGAIERLDATVASLRRNGIDLALGGIDDDTIGLKMAASLSPSFARLDPSMTRKGRVIGARFLQYTRLALETTGAEIIASGIESEDDVEMARNAGIRFGQGPHFTRGM